MKFSVKKNQTQIPYQNSLFVRSNYTQYYLSKVVISSSFTHTFASGLKTNNLGSNFFVSKESVDMWHSNETSSSVTNSFNDFLSIFKGGKKVVQSYHAIAK